MKKVWKGMAVVLCLSLMCSLCACNGNSGGEAGQNSEEVNLVWYLRSTEPAGFDEVQEEINQYTLDKINATVEIRFIQPGDWQQKMQMVMAAKEEFDLVFTGDWASDFSNMVNMGGLMPLNDLLESTPELKAMYSDAIWDATSFNGEIYGVPNNQVIYEQKGLCFIKDMVDKYSLPVHEISSLEDLTEIYQTIKDNEPADIIPARKGFVGQFDPFETNIKDFVIRDGKVVDPFDERLPQYILMRDWYQRGFFPGDVATLTDDASLTKAGKIFCTYGRYLPGSEEKFNLTHDYEIYHVATNEPFILRASVQSAMTSISATSKNPERAIQLLQLLQTDKYLLNLISYGIEGRDYQKDPENENRINRSADAYYVGEFMVGNQFLAYLQPSYSDTVWQETEEANNNAAADPNIGFAFDQDPVKTEITNLESVNKEFITILENGLADPESTYQQVQEKKDLAGRQKIMEEIQSQYDAWLAQQ